ncbi:energy transducer TonB [Pseudomonas sp. PDM16]|uniref:energy transducer TonB n=1 Tax=Pseudomonas sp. PDM16 TaxID=2769292 RepID=UPI00298C9E2F|nr:energy transducer TonB [Pseudomonas sp. PDM16]
MSALVMQATAPLALAAPSSRWLRSFLAAGVAVGLHALVLGLLLTHWQADTPPAPQVRTLTTRLVTLAPPAPPQPEAVLPTTALPEPEPAKPVEAPKPDPRIEQQKLEQAALARKRVEEQRERQEREQVERQRIERERREADELARQQAQQRQAEAQARADAEAADRARQAEAAAAASRQYLPIAKEAPDYPERALDKGIEGDCTVTYRVSPQGRVEDPQTLGDCHPLFVRPSLAAARTFRYQPRVVDGRAVAVDGVKNTFHYRIE